jgi:hypothetical protein
MPIDLNVFGRKSIGRLLLLHNFNFFCFGFDVM